MRNEGVGSKIADICIYIFISLFGLSILFPFYNMILISFAEYGDVIRSSFYLYPKSFTMENYNRIFSDTKLVDSIFVSVRNVITGTAMSLAVTVFASYALSRRNVPFRRGMFYICIFTMYFSGGLIPWYLVLKEMGFVDSIWVMTVPSMLSTFNMILVRNYFLSLPESLEESARLDGA
jgi:putative aldouronate transport system permease protein